MSEKNRISVKLSSERPVVDPAVKGLHSEKLVSPEFRQNFQIWGSRESERDLSGLVRRRKWFPALTD